VSVFGLLSRRISEMVQEWSSIAADD